LTLPPAMQASRNNEPTPRPFRVKLPRKSGPRLDSPHSPQKKEPPETLAAPQGVSVLLVSFLTPRQRVMESA